MSRSLSKRTRFEVLKRDSFACQYCGAAAPDAYLHVDHIIPVSKGGTDDPTNLDELQRVNGRAGGPGPYGVVGR